MSNLYSKHRESLYEALMGPLVFVPEGETDYRWLRVLQRAAETIISVSAASDLTPMTIVPTQSSAVADTYADISRLRPDAVPLIDGDSSGDSYLQALEKLALKPGVVVQYGKGAAVECLVAWILEPSLASPGPTVAGLLPNASQRTLKGLQQALVANKKDYGCAEELAWEAIDNPQCTERLLRFFGELAVIVGGVAGSAQLKWTVGQRPSGVKLCVAAFVEKL